PGRGLGVAAEVARLAPHHPEGVVDDLLGQVVAVREACEEARHPAVIEMIELLECPAIALRDACDEGHLTRHRGCSAITRLCHSHAVITRRLHPAPFIAVSGSRPVFGSKSPCVRLSAVVSARSKVPAHRSGKVVIGDGIGEELARLLLGEEITEVEPPAAPLEREARVAVPVAGGCEAAWARAGRAVIAGTPGREHPVTDQPLAGR